jgi:hypothetical protein
MKTIAKITDSPDNIYYNVSMVNNSITFGNLANYTSNKTIPLLDNADDYYMSIVSFSIPLNYLPLMVCPIQTTLNNTLNTPLVIGIRDFNANITYAQNLIYIPTLTEFPAPVQNGSSTPIITPYYYIYNYETIINMMNSALTASYNIFKLANPGSPHLCPFFIYDATTTLVSLIADISWVNSLQSIVCNIAMYNFLDSMPFKTYAPTIPNETTDVVLQIYNTGNNGYPTNTFPVNPAYVRMSMNYSTMFLWSSLKKLLITTNSLPINFEQAPVFNNLNPDQYNSTPILADFTPSISQAGDSREIAYYFATYYRLIDLKSSGPLNKINIQIYWQDTYNNIYPLYIPIFQEATIKFVFTKKDLYLNQ